MCVRGKFLAAETPFGKENGPRKSKPVCKPHFCLVHPRPFLLAGWQLCCQKSSPNWHKSGLLIFHAVVEPRNSGKSAKSCEIHKNIKNTTKFGRNLIKYYLLFIVLFALVVQSKKKSNYLNSHGEEAQKKPPGN